MIKINPDMKRGQDFAMNILPVIRELEANAIDPVHWWAGFIPAIMGFAGAGIGPDAVRVLGECVSEIVAEHIQEKAH